VLDGVESGAQVSDRGRFQNVRGIIKNTPGHGDGRAPPAYQRVGINRKNYLFDRLVCSAWHGPRPTPEHTQVKHKDSGHSNNTPANLEWATRTENSHHLPANNLNRTSRSVMQSKPVRGRKMGTEDEWRQFELCTAVMRELGPGFFLSSVSRVANG